MNFDDLRKLSDWLGMHRYLRDSTTSTREPFDDSSEDFLEDDDSHGTDDDEWFDP